MAENTDDIRGWRSIITLIVFVITNINVLFPFHIPFYIPKVLSDLVLGTLRGLRVIAPVNQNEESNDVERSGIRSKFVRLEFPMNFVTAPLIADLFLLAIQAIDGTEVRGGTIGTESIHPLDIMLFFITLAYIAISIDASGLIRYLAFKVLQWGGEVGHRLFLYLYAFFFGLGSFIGNDPIILSGTAFLAYMTRVSSNIVHPRAWIHTQFAIANIASAILVSSNPTNLVLAGAFHIKFIDYTANMIVPVIITAIVLFPFLLYIVFANESLIPYSIKMHELPEEVKARKPVNPNIPHARGNAEEEENRHLNDEQGKLLSLEEIMNPFLDKRAAAFGALVMSTTLITLLALNAASTEIGDHPVFWVTLPAAFVMLCWDVVFGWYYRHETREIARKGREEVERTRIEREIRAAEDERRAAEQQTQDNAMATDDSIDQPGLTKESSPEAFDVGRQSVQSDIAMELFQPRAPLGMSSSGEMDEKRPEEEETRNMDDLRLQEAEDFEANIDILVTNELRRRRAEELSRPKTMVSRSRDTYRWCQETFPTVTAVLAHLPFALIPFAFTMFVLVQALVTKGWVKVFASGWAHWVNKTGPVGAISGMGFLSVILCNFAGTNIGTTILLSRVIQEWTHIKNMPNPISERTFWATVYSMALGVNYGAFSTAFSASLAGLLWRDILARKHIRVRSLDFARVNLPIIAIAMTVGCAVLIGEVYIIKPDTPLGVSTIS